MASFPRSVLLLVCLGLSLASCQANIIIPAEGRISHVPPQANSAPAASQAAAPAPTRVPEPREVESDEAASDASPLVPIGLPIAKRPTASDPLGADAAERGSGRDPLVGRVSTYDHRLNLAAIKSIGAVPVFSALSFDVAMDRQGNTYFGLMVAREPAHGADYLRIFVKVTPDGKNLYYTPGAGWTEKLTHTFQPGFHGTMTVDGDGRLYYAYIPSPEMSALHRVSADGRTVEVFKNAPIGIDRLSVDAKGNVYFADRDKNTLMRLTAAGKLEAIAGSGSLGVRDGQGASASFNRPNDVVPEPAGSFLVSEISMVKGEAYHLRRVTAAGVVTTLPLKFSLNGELKPALVNNFGVAVDACGTLYLSDQTVGVIYRGTEKDGAVVLTEWVGSSSERGYIDGIGKAARFKFQTRLFMPGGDRLLVIDDGNKVVRQIQ
ncbi:SMP-30/Gluconolaconase/LRE-like region [compost metagenome]